jgi:hypothetical protein
MSERDVVQTAYDDWGAAHGFKKKSGSWYGAADDVISVTNLQNSQYSKRYFVNQGFWLRQLEEDLFPKDHKCHIRMRLGALVGDEAARLDQLLDLEFEMDEHHRFEELTRIFDTILLPVIERGSSLAGLRGLDAAGALRAASISGPARELLGLQSSDDFRE